MERCEIPRSRKINANFVKSEVWNVWFKSICRQLAMYKRMQFGQKRERFEGDPNQTMLPFEAEPAEVVQQQEEIKEKIEYVRKRPNHKGLNYLRTSL